MRWIALQACTIKTPENGQPNGHPVLDWAELQCVLGSLALGFTPRVALVDEAVLMDVTGSLRLFGGPTGLVQLLTRKITLFFQSNQAFVQLKRAEGATSLIALGRLRFQSCPSGLVKVRAAELPMQTLSAARPHLAVLERIGCRNWADLVRLPRDGVARRFGDELLAALDRARGAIPDSYRWMVLPEQFAEKIELDASIDHAPALMDGISHLLARLQAWLVGRQSGICAIKIVWHLDKRRDVAPTGDMDIRTDQPAQDLRHITRLIAERLARQQLPAPVHALSLQSLVTQRLTDAEAATGSLLIDEHRRSGASAVELVERLSARLGDEQVRVWQACADHRPEHMQRWVVAREALGTIKSIAASARNTRARSIKDIKKPFLQSAGAAGHGAAALRHEKPLPRLEPLYPSWLLEQPLQLAAHGNSPVYQGKLTRLAGPQRLEASGWLVAGEGPGEAGQTRARPPAMRDYFIYRSEQGSLLWIYTERLSRSNPAAAPVQRAWFLHGFFA